jgi:hypothetical protein
MKNDHDISPADAAELDALMARVRDAVARRKDTHTTPASAPISLDGILRQQSEFNEAVARALAALSDRVAELKRK